MAPKLQIVDGLTGQPLCEVEVAAMTWTVRDVKLAIREAVGVHPREQRLVSAGRAVRKNGEEVGKSLMADLLVPGARGVLRLVRIDPSWEIHLNFLEDAALVLSMGPSWHDGDPAAMAQARELLKKHDFVLAAVQEAGGTLHHAAEELKHDRTIVLAAVRENGTALAFAAEELRADRDMVLEAINENGMALEFAAETLRSDRDVVMVAVHQCGEALRFAAGEIRWDRDLALQAIRRSAAALQLVPLYIQHDRQFVLAAVSANGDALQHVDEELRNDREIVQAAEQFWSAETGQVHVETSPRRAIPFLQSLAKREEHAADVSAT